MLKSLPAWNAVAPAEMSTEAWVVQVTKSLAVSIVNVRSAAFVCHADLDSVPDYQAWLRSGLSASMVSPVPHSAHWGISTVVEHVVRARPSSMLDVGCGYGKWGYLVREALDFVENRRVREEWRVRIDGIDAFPVESPILEWAYNSVRLADVASIEAPTGYDVVILGDVIEHLTKPRGWRLIDDLCAGNGTVVVSTPREWFAQGEIDGNPFERHLSFWQDRDFACWPAEIDVRGGTVIVAIRGIGDYPSESAVRASRVVRSIPGLRDRGALSSAVKEALRLVVERNRTASDRGRGRRGGADRA